MEKKLNDDTEMNVGMTDEQIVKALECCSSALTGEACEKCPLRGECVSKSNTIEELALDLIQRQKAEIERLTEYNANLNGMCLEFTDKNTELQKQVDELIEELCETRICATVLSEKLKAKEQAVKDTAKEIYSEIGDDDILVIGTQEYGKIEVVPLERLQEIIRSKGVEVE